MKLDEVFHKLTLDLPSGISCLKIQSQRKSVCVDGRTQKTEAHAIIFSLVGDFSMFSEEEPSRLSLHLRRCNSFEKTQKTFLRTKFPLERSCTEQYAEIPFSLEKHKSFDTT